MDLYTIRNKLNMGIPLTNIKLKVTDYARVSTEHIEQKKSLQNQVEHFQEYIKQNKNWTYVEGYIDDGITGTSDIKRDNFMKMIEDAKLGKFDLIITKEISRFSRNTLDSIKYTRLLLSYGVFVLFVNDNINTALPDSELRLTIMASMAQDEIRRLSERVKFGMNRAILRGELLGNNLLYGYKKDKNTKNLTIIENEANVIRRIYKLYVIDKYSLSKIANLLNKENITTREGNKWSSTSISRMITNPKYKGFYCGKKSEVIDYMTKKIKHLDSTKWITYENKEKIPQIIDEILWDKANRRLNSRKKHKNNTNNKYLYSGKIFCSKDNTIFNRRIFRRHNKDITWICSTYLNKGKNYCNTPNIRESELNIILKNLISKLNINLSDVTTILISKYNSINYNKTSTKDLIKEQKLIYQKKEKLLELNINNNISNDEFTVRNNLFNDRLKSIEERINIISQNKVLNLTELETYLNNELKSDNIIEKLINILLNKIIVSKDKNIINLKIYLNLKEIPLSLSDNYIFRRGDDTKCTKRYSINYNVEYYLSD